MSAAGTSSASISLFSSTM